ncbi:MAG TPA: hypothetical protein VM890_15270 [Longimicrobium sp.]|jgi:hypothetical protein|nr:hypothetical protein [Longimicrobium sp.]
MPMTPTVVQSLALQVLVAVITMGIGVLALRVAPGPGTSARTAAWFIAGVTFASEGLVATFHSILAVGAALAGPGTVFYTVYLRFMPAGNDARVVVVFGFALGLGWVLLLGRPSPGKRTIVAATAVLLAAGFVAGLFEPPVAPQQGADHFSVMSYFGAATAVLLFAALYRAMVRETVDWLLWVALALYAVQEALSSNIQIVLSWAGLSGGWSPPAKAMLWAGLVSAFAMLACAARRLAIARAGGEVPGLLERLRG